MGAEAVKGLLKKTGKKPEEIELVICATIKLYLTDIMRLPWRWDTETVVRSSYIIKNCITDSGIVMRGDPKSNFGRCTQRRRACADLRPSQSVVRMITGKDTAEAFQFQPHWKALPGNFMYASASARCIPPDKLGITRARSCTEHYHAGIVGK